MKRILKGIFVFAVVLVLGGMVFGFFCGAKVFKPRDPEIEIFTTEAEVGPGKCVFHSGRAWVTTEVTVQDKDEHVAKSREFWSASSTDVRVENDTLITRSKLPSFKTTKVVKGKPLN